jgi:hypothetical protein
MQDWSLHNANTGGHYQCNRFANAAVNPVEGSARHEAMRIKAKGRQVSWFLHHFTRFKAHSDSAVLEARMHKETILRVADGLIRSARRDIKWLQGGRVQNPVLSHSADQVGLPTNRALLGTLRKDFTDFAVVPPTVDVVFTAGAPARKASKEEASAPAAQIKSKPPSAVKTASRSISSENADAVTVSMTSRLAAVANAAVRAAQLGATTSMGSPSVDVAFPYTSLIASDHETWQPIPDDWIASFESDVSFLNDGFEELLRCRCVSNSLQEHGSFLFDIFGCAVSSWHVRVLLFNVHGGDR